MGWGQGLHGPVLEPWVRWNLMEPLDAQQPPQDFRETKTELKREIRDREEGQSQARRRDFCHCRPI